MIRILAILTIAGALLSCASDKGAAPGKLVFRDDFNRAELGASWLDTGGGYRIVAGELRAEGARNKPLWLVPKLPPNARVEIDARSASEAVDIKLELFGDGRSRPTTVSYTATSYVFILGGWGNSRSIIARMNEHGKDRQVRTEPRGVPGKTYRFSVTRSGSHVSWLVDREVFLEMDDPEPLVGPGHEHLAFNNWESEVFFDNLAIYEI